MDFLDPKKRRSHTIRLMVGYVLLGIAILLGTTVLLYQANGFDVRQGKIVQNGLIFVSSRPGGATVSIDGQKRDTTGARLVLPAGNYKMQLDRVGYHTWQRAVTLEGNSVSRFDYPMLIPKTLVTDKVVDYAAAPVFSMQSPDRRWLLVQQPGKTVDFDMYDLRDPKKIAANRKTVSLPAELLTAPTSESQLKLVEASNDNRHFLLRHIVGENSEYILFDRTEPAQSRNLTRDMNLNAGAVLSLQNKRYDRYFILDTATGALGTTTLQSPDISKPVAQNVAAFKSYGDDVVLYVTPEASDPAKTNLMLLQDGKARQLRTMAVQADRESYLLDLAKYDGAWFIAAGAPTENRVYVYKDPTAKLEAKPDDPVVPIDVLKVNAPNFVKFSANTQFIMTQGNQHFAVYDNEADRHYAYDMDLPMDAPQQHADWMDGDRIVYVSGGKFIEFDYDGTNRQTLAASLPNQTFFDRDYEYQYSLAPTETAGRYALTRTSLLIPADQ